MAVTVLPVDTTSYSSAAFDDILEAVSCQGDAATQGVVRNKLNELEVTGAATPIAVDTGWAMVNGKLVKNSASVNLNVASPAVNPRIDRAVIRIDYTSSPVSASIALLAGVEAAVPAAPALTQTDGTTWELSLAQVHITAAGVITLTDEREYLGAGHVDVNSFVAGALAANATGRAVMEAGLFDEATVLDKFGTDSFTNAVLLQLIRDNAFAANAATRALFAAGFIGANLTGRALMESGYFDAATALDKFAASAIANSLLAADARRMVGEITLFYGTLGGSDGHRPVIGGVANENWHLCNGDAPGGVTTPDLRNRFVVGAGATYAQGATGGATTSAHTHAVGTLFMSNNSAGTSPFQAGAGAVALANDPHDHTMGGSTASASPSILPPYYGVYYIMKVA